MKITETLPFEQADFPTWESIAFCLWGKNSSMGTYLLMMALSLGMFAELMLAEINWDCMYRKRWRIELGLKKYIVNSLVVRKINICKLTYYLGYDTHIAWPLLHREFSYSSQYNLSHKMTEDNFRWFGTMNQWFHFRFFNLPSGGKLAGTGNIGACDIHKRCVCRIGGEILWELWYHPYFLNHTDAALASPSVPFCYVIIETIYK